uniref:Uncharacterized protein n=1 Tax=Rhizophora mucronata TaxID=61149 RepID=A0A2P2PS29_RHIMU
MLLRHTNSCVVLPFSRCWLPLSILLLNDARQGCAGLVGPV